MTARLAILSNPRSERNRMQPGSALRGASAIEGVVAEAELRDFGALPRILAEFRRRGADVLVIDGGDGTVQGVLTELMRQGIDASTGPRLAVVASGMTNLIAADVGVRGRGEDALRRLARALDSGEAEVARRQTVRLDLPSDLSRSLSGMFFGAAALYRGAELARRRIHARGVKHAAGVALTIGAIAARSLFSRDDAFFAGDEIDLRLDDGPPDVRNRFLLMATTLERLVLGMRPFWGGGSGALRYLDVPAPPKWILAAMPLTLLRRPSAWMERAGYRSGRAERISLSLNAPCLLDGEVVPAAPGDRITLSAGNPVEFVRA